jgi:hypothetical protein
VGVKLTTEPPRGKIAVLIERLESELEAKLLRDDAENFGVLRV